MHYYTAINIMYVTTDSSHADIENLADSNNVDIRKSLCDRILPIARGILIILAAVSFISFIIGGITCSLLDTDTRTFRILAATTLGTMTISVVTTGIIQIIIEYRRGTLDCSLFE
jgi:hypothetical protein